MIFFATSSKRPRLGTSLREALHGAALLLRGPQSQTLLINYILSATKII